MFNTNYNYNITNQIPLYNNLITNNQFNNKFNLDKINVNTILSSLPLIDTLGGFGFDLIQNNKLISNQFFADPNFLILLLRLILSNFGKFSPNTSPTNSPISSPMSIKQIQPTNINPTSAIPSFLTTPQVAGFKPSTQNTPINQPNTYNNQNNKVNYENQENQTSNTTNTNNNSNATPNIKQNELPNQGNNQNNQNREYDTEFIKGFEGFSPTPYGDYQQLSIGYGTKAKSPNEVITKEEAEQRMIEHIENYVKPGIINIVGQERWNNLDYNQKTALISLAYNLGVGGSSEILKLVRDGNIQGAAEEMKQYVHAGGQVLEGLVRRREAEAKLLLS